MAVRARKASRNPGAGGTQPHVANDRFDDDGGDVGASFGERDFNGVDGVEGQHDGRLGEGFGDTGGVGDTEGREAGARLDQ